MYQNCKAFLFPQIEDAGIAPLEAMASGRPVIALKAGGVVDVLKDGETGVFFEEQTVESLGKAIDKFEKSKFDLGEIRKHAEGFSTEEFQKKIEGFVGEKYEEWNK